MRLGRCLSNRADRRLEKIFDLGVDLSPPCAGGRLVAGLQGELELAVPLRSWSSSAQGSLMVPRIWLAILGGNFLA